MNNTPLYAIPTGKFIGWKCESSNLIYNSNGINIGQFVNDIAYSLSGDYIGELVNGRYLGFRTDVQYEPIMEIIKSTELEIQVLPDGPEFPFAGYSEPRIT